jgi:hypothetical protein
LADAQGWWLSPDTPPKRAKPKDLVPPTRQMIQTASRFSPLILPGRAFCFSVSAGCSLWGERRYSLTTVMAAPACCPQCSPPLDFLYPTITKPRAAFLHPAIGRPGVYFVTVPKRQAFALPVPNRRRDCPEKDLAAGVLAEGLCSVPLSCSPIAVTGHCHMRSHKDVVRLSLHRLPIPTTEQDEVNAIYHRRLRLFGVGVVVIASEPLFPVRLHVVSLLFRRDPERDQERKSCLSVRGIGRRNLHAA